MTNQETSRSSEHTLSTLLADLETTASDQLMVNDVLVQLNFASLFHEKVYLTDTVLGDNGLIISDYLSSSPSGLYRRLRDLIGAGIVCGLFRDHVAVRDQVLTSSRPTLEQIYDGWRLRGPDEAFTARQFGPLRRRYLKEIDQLLFQQFENAVTWYNPDKVKHNYRTRIESQLSAGKPLSRLLQDLPPELKYAFQKTCETNRYFTNADLWTLLKGEKRARDVVSACGHLNQQTYADWVHAGLYGHDRSDFSLADFNWEANSESVSGVVVTPPVNLEQLFEEAREVLPAPAPQLIGKLELPDILQLREKARIFEIAKEGARSNLDEFQREYLKAFGEYWRHILEEIERKFPDECQKKSRLAIIVEKHIPNLSAFYKKWQLPVLTTVIRTQLAPFLPEPATTVAAGALAGGADKVLRKLEIWLLYERTEEMKKLDHLLPPRQWATNSWGHAQV